MLAEAQVLETVKQTTSREIRALSSNMVIEDQVMD